MLVHEWPTVLRVAAQAELIGIGHPQVVARRTTVWVMAIHAVHLSFAQRVVVRELHLGALGLMALQATFGHRGSPLQHHAAFRHKFLNERGMARGGSLNIHTAHRRALGGYRVDLVTVRASNAVRLVGAGQPVSDPRILDMATQANAVGIFNRPDAKSNDLGHVAIASLVQASRAVAVLALHPLLGMKRVPEIVSNMVMTLHTRFRPYARGACNLHVFRKGVNTISRFLLRR